LSSCETGTRVANFSSPLHPTAARRRLPRHSLLIPALSLRRHPTPHRRCHVIHRHAIRQPSYQSPQYWNGQRHLCYPIHRHLCQQRLRTWRRP
jgi:hypothetical protein